MKRTALTVGFLGLLLWQGTMLGTSSARAGDAFTEGQKYLREKIDKLGLSDEERATALLYLEARKLAREGKTKAAIDALEKVAAKDPDGKLIDRACEGQLLRDLASALERSGQLAQAIPVLEKRWRAAPAPSTLWQLTRVVDQMKPEFALKYYDDKVRLGKDEFRPYLAKSTYCYYLWDLNRAGAEQKKAGKVIEERDDVDYDRAKAFKAIWAVIEQDVALNDSNVFSYLGSADRPAIFDPKWALETFRFPKVKEFLRNEVDSKSDGVALLAIVLLAKLDLKDEAITGKLETLSKSKNESISKAAAAILGSLRVRLKTSM